VTRLFEELQPGAERLVTAGVRAAVVPPVDTTPPRSPNPVVDGQPDG